MDSNIESLDRRRPPANVIVPQRKVESFERHFNDHASQLLKLGEKTDGLILDLDIIAAQVTQNQAILKSQAMWNWIRDLIVILLLVACVGLVIWRGLLLDHRLERGEGVAVVSTGHP